MFTFIKVCCSIIYKCTKHYNYLQTHLHLIQATLQASKLLKTHICRHQVIKNAKLIKAWMKLKCSLYTDAFKFSFLSKTYFDIWTIRVYVASPKVIIFKMLKTLILASFSTAVTYSSNMFLRSTLEVNVWTFLHVEITVVKR